MVGTTAIMLVVATTAGCAEDSRDPFAFDSAAPLKYGTTSSAVDRRDWSTMVSWWSDEEPSTSFGIDLCIAPDTDVSMLQINGVGPYESVGDVAPLPPLLASGTAVDDQFISKEGYPPALSSTTRSEPLEGSRLTQVCDRGEGFQRVVIGLRAASPTGGGWDGVVVRYEVDGKQRNLHVPVSLFMCGTSTEPCG